MLPSDLADVEWEPLSGNRSDPESGEPHETGRSSRGRICGHDRDFRVLRATAQRPLPLALRRAVLILLRSLLEPRTRSRRDRPLYAAQVRGPESARGID